MINYLIHTTMQQITDKFILGNNIAIPCIGYGTWQTPDGETAVNAILESFKAGYRHIDTAAAYGNEQSVGAAVAKSGIKREDLFITSKLWNSSRGYDKTLKAFDESIKNLQLEYMDLYLIHWPAAKGSEWAKTNIDTWRAFEKLYYEGRIKSIGVSNFLKHHLEPLMQEAKVAPMINQIEFHPGQMQNETFEFCKQHKIVVEAWSPLGQGKMLENAALKEIAEKYGKTTAQVCIKWCLQNQVLPLPKSVTPLRIAENIDVFDFIISNADMATINAMHYFGGSGLHPDKVNF